MQAISAQNVANRRGGEANVVAPSTHTGGSKPHFMHIIDNTEDGEEPNHIDMYKALHQTNVEPWNEKVKAVLEAFDKMKFEDAALASQSPLIEDNKRFLDVLEPRKKGRRDAVRTGSSLTPSEVYEHLHQRRQFHLAMRATIVKWLRELWKSCIRD